MSEPPPVPEVARGGVARQVTAVEPDSMLVQSCKGARNVLRTVLLAWRGITRRQVRVTCVIGVVLCVGLFTFLQVPLDSPGRVLVTAVASQLRAFSLLLAFVVADRVTAGDPSRRGPYVWAVLVGAAVSSAMPVALGAAVTRIWNWNEFYANLSEPSVWSYAYEMGDTLLIAGATMWVILDRRRAAFARERMVRAELDRIAVERRSIESDLQAMQARVEPQFLFNTLAQVRALYREDAARGARMLDELIAYLRAAMPKMRDTTSTLGQEVELVRAYLAIVEVRLGDRLSVSIDVCAADCRAHIPSMLLLPLVDRFIRRDNPSAAHSITIRAGVANGKTRLTIIDSAGASAVRAEGTVIADIRGRLAALFGPQASLELHRRDGHATEVALEVPLESGPAPVAAPLDQANH